MEGDFQPNDKAAEKEGFQAAVGRSEVLNALILCGLASAGPQRRMFSPKVATSPPSVQSRT